MKNPFLLTILFTGFTLFCVAQNPDSLQSISVELKGVLLDADTKDPLPYANIVVKRINRGAITNEVGEFSIDTTGLIETDSISFLYIGYKTTEFSVDEILESGTVLLQEDIQNLNKVFVFGTPPDAKDIVKRVVENRSKNYKLENSQTQVFYRSRYDQEIQDYKLKYKKSSISVLDEKMIQELEDKTPRNSTSYTDFLGDLYYSSNTDDSIQTKLNPIKTVSLKEKDVADMDQIETVFKEVFSNTEQEEYWKLKMGIIGLDMEVNMDEDSTATKSEKPKDSRKVKGSLSSLKSALSYSRLKDIDAWEFLYSTGKYRYTLIGGTNVGKEDVYVIDFAPKGGGSFEGRLYVSVDSYALIRADYEYGAGKTGTDVQLFGIGYHENYFSGSILFERVDSTYQLKYCAKQVGNKINIDRSFAIVKKRKRFLWDKTMKEVKIGVDMGMTSNESFEIMVLEQKPISSNGFEKFTQKKYHKVQYVEQFDDNLWKGYSIIEPTKKMREYIKREE